jgi:hypothetical protein
VGLGLGFTIPGGAASSTGAPHWSQKSPSRSSGPLQNRQTAPPAALDTLSGSMSSNRVLSGSTRPGAGAPALAGAGNSLLGKSVETGAARSLGLRDFASFEVGVGVEGFAAVGLEAGGSMPSLSERIDAAGSGVPHWVQNRNPSGASKLHLGQAVMGARRALDLPSCS